MKKFIILFGVVALAGAITGCSSERHSKTTTRETVESVPADPVVIEKRSSTHTETRTSD